MWFWIIIIVAVIGGIIGYMTEGKSEDALSGALSGGCLAAGCIARIAFCALCIIIVLWLFSVLF